MTDECRPRLMPERSFYGQASQWIMFGLIDDFSGQQRALAPGESRLGGFILPTFQRSAVWTPPQKTRLIESLYMGLPIGSLVYNQTRNLGPCHRWLLDGQQRMVAITEYVAGKWPIYGWLFPSLPEIEQRHFKRIGVGVIETQIESEAECRDIYDRLAYGGTAHEPKEQRQSEAEAAPCST